jgi:hypothetical protein
MDPVEVLLSFMKISTAVSQELVLSTSSSSIATLEVLVIWY